MPSFLLHIALILYSIVVVILRARLKAAFNGPTVLIFIQTGAGFFTEK